MILSHRNSKIFDNFQLLYKMFDCVNLNCSIKALPLVEFWEGVGRREIVDVSQLRSLNRENFSPENKSLLVQSPN